MPALIFAVPLVVLLSALVLIGMNKAWSATLGPMLIGIGRMFAVLSFVVPIINRRIGLGFIGNAFFYAEKQAHRAFGAAITWVEQPLSVFITYMGSVFEAPTEQLAGVVADVAHTLGALRRTIIPAMIGARIHWIIAHLQRLEAQGARVVHDVTRVVVHEAPRVVKSTVIRYTHAAVALPLPRIGRLERDVEAYGARVVKLERRLVGAGLTAGVIAIVARLWPFLQCKNVGKVGRHLCSWPVKALEDLLAGVIDLFLLLDLCELVGIMEKTALSVEPWIERFGAEINTLAKCRSVPAARPLPLAPVLIPPVKPTFTSLSG